MLQFQSALFRISSYCTLLKIIILKSLAYSLYFVVFTFKKNIEELWLTATVCMKWLTGMLCPSLVLSRASGKRWVALISSLSWIGTVAQLWHPHSISSWKETGYFIASSCRLCFSTDGSITDLATILIGWQGQFY